MRWPAPGRGRGTPRGGGSRRPVTRATPRPRRAKPQASSGTASNSARGKRRYSTIGTLGPERSTSRAPGLDEVQPHDLRARRGRFQPAWTFSSAGPCTASQTLGPRRTPQPGHGPSAHAEPCRPRQPSARTDLAGPPNSSARHEPRRRQPFSPTTGLQPAQNLSAPPPAFDPRRTPQPATGLQPAQNLSTSPPAFDPRQTVQAAPDPSARTDLTNRAEPLGPHDPRRAANSSARTTLAGPAKPSARHDPRRPAKPLGQHEPCRAPPTPRPATTLQPSPAPEPWPQTPSSRQPLRPIHRPRVHAKTNPPIHRPRPKPGRSARHRPSPRRTRSPPPTFNPRKASQQAGDLPVLNPPRKPKAPPKRSRPPPSARRSSSPPR